MTEDSRGTIVFVTKIKTNDIRNRKTKTFQAHMSLTPTSLFLTRTVLGSDRRNNTLLLVILCSG